MIVGILSDTHSCWDERYATHFSNCDEIWHAGDIGDIQLLERLKELAPTLRAVRGNIDHGIVARQCDELLDFTTSGLRVLMTHIGGYPGKYAPNVRQILKESNSGSRHTYDIMVSGHSHILKVMHDPRHNLLHLNPGAAGTQGWQKQRTLMRLHLEPGIIKDLEIIELGKAKL